MCVGGWVGGCGGRGQIMTFDVHRLVHSHSTLEIKVLNKISSHASNNNFQLLYTCTCIP